MLDAMYILFLAIIYVILFAVEYYILVRTRDRILALYESEDYYDDDELEEFDKN